MIRALGVEDFIQCPYPSMGCPASSSDGWPGGVHLLAEPLLPASMWLLVHVAPWRGWRGFHTSDEVLGPFIRGDVEVCLPEQLFGGDGCFLEYGSDEGRVIRSTVEVFNYRRLVDFGCNTLGVTGTKT